MTIQPISPTYRTIGHDPNQWTPDRIRHYYDTHLNLTLAELSRITGLSIPQLKKILMS